VKNIKQLLVAALIWVVAVSLIGCGAKDLVSLADIGKGDLFVGDRFGNKVKIEDPADFIKAFKEAKLVKDAKDAKSETEADYVFYSGDKKVYYEAKGMYLIYVDKGGKKHVYSADLAQLLSEVEGLPPVLTQGFQDQEIGSWLDELAKITEPSAILFDTGDEPILVVMAGEKPTAGYELNLEDVTISNGVLTVHVRLVPPSETAAQVLSYPYAGFTLSKKADVEVRMIYTGKDGDEVIHVPVAQVEKGQNIILLKPERGSILTERVKMVGFARVHEGTFSVEVEDGHNVLGIKSVTASKSAPEWGYFEFWMDLEQPTSPYGMIIFVTQSAQDGSRVEELMVPIGFGGK